MSPGSVTEIVYFFVCEYTPSQRVTAGGGVEEEDIEVLELTIDAGAGKRSLTAKSATARPSCCCSMQR